MPKKKKKEHNGPPISPPSPNLASVDDLDSADQIAIMEQYISEQKRKLGIGEAPSSSSEDAKDIIRQARLLIATIKGEEVPEPSLSQPPDLDNPTQVEALEKYLYEQKKKLGMLKIKERKITALEDMLDVLVDFLKALSFEGKFDFSVHHENDKPFQIKLMIDGNISEKDFDVSEYMEKPKKEGIDA